MSRQEQAKKSIYLKSALQRALVKSVLLAVITIVSILTTVLFSQETLSATAQEISIRTIEGRIQIVEVQKQVLLEAPKPLTPEEQEELDRRLESVEKELRDLRAARTEITERTASLQAFAAILTSIVFLSTFLATTLYHIWQERRDRTEHALEIEMKKLEIEKLRQEVIDSQQKDRKR